MRLLSALQPIPRQLLLHMWRIYLSYAQLEEYFAMLVPVMMLERDPMTDSYRVTSKATEFLNAYERVQELLKI